jgi:hypothetical protein
LRLTRDPYTAGARIFYISNMVELSKTHEAFGRWPLPTARCLTTLKTELDRIGTLLPESAQFNA